MSVLPELLSIFKAFSGLITKYTPSWQTGAWRASIVGSFLLESRKLRAVTIFNRFSILIEMIRRVPQGSVFNPILFLVYDN